MDGNQANRITVVHEGTKQKVRCKCDHKILCMMRFANCREHKKAKNYTAHDQYLKDQRKNGKGSLFAFLEPLYSYHQYVGLAIGEPDVKVWNRNLE